MSLSSALSIAQSALQTTSRQTSVVSRNITNAYDPNYARREAVVVSTAPGARMVQIQRAANEQLFRQNLAALSAWEGQNAVLEGLETLTTAVNGSDNATSAATLIGALQKALDLYANTPSNSMLAENAVEAARQVVRGLNDGSKVIQDFRADTDAEIATAVDDLNKLLADFDAANRQVVSDTRAGRDASDALDQRDTLLKKISELVPISTVTRGDNDMVVMTSDGTMLYETSPRTITFEPRTSYSATTAGNAVYVDGIPLSGGSGGNTNASGQIAGLLQLRDSVAPTMQAQLDEIGRGLITAFAETTPAGTNPLAGLFTWSGGPAIPPTGTLTDGLAASITVNPLVDSAVGGNPELLRDGGINGAAYRWNTTPPAASYSDLLNAYNDRLATPIAFDPSAGAGTNATIGDYSADSISWIEGLRKAASNATESKNALMMRTQEALSNTIGVNEDYEWSLMLDLEHSYQASAKLLSTVDEMLSQLLEAVG
jgi:flagellar hook-associated protein 1 FlgK